MLRHSRSAACRPRASRSLSGVLGQCSALATASLEGLLLRAKKNITGNCQADGSTRQIG